MVDVEVLDVEMVDAEAHDNAVLGVVLGAAAVPCRPRTVCKGPSSPRPSPEPLRPAPLLPPCTSHIALLHPDKNRTR